MCCAFYCSYHVLDGNRDVAKSVEVFRNCFAVLNLTMKMRKQKMLTNYFCFL